VGEPTWKRLVEELRANDQPRTAHLDPLRDRFSIAGSFRELAREVLSEMACALRRSEDKVTASLERLDRHAKAIDELRASKRRDERWRRAIGERIDAFNCERDVAAHSLWELRVHREALGFLRNDDLADLFPIPPRRD